MANSSADSVEPAALPIDTYSAATFMMLYRKDMWAAGVTAGLLPEVLPRTWEELISMAEGLVRAGHALKCTRARKGRRGTCGILT